MSNGALVYKTRFTNYRTSCSRIKFMQTVVKDIIASAKTKVYCYNYSATVLLLPSRTPSLKIKIGYLSSKLSDRMV